MIGKLISKFEVGHILSGGTRKVVQSYKANDWVNYYTINLLDGFDQLQPYFSFLAHPLLVKRLDRGSPKTSVFREVGGGGGKENVYETKIKSKINSNL